MYIMESSDIRRAAAIAVRQGQAVLIVQTGLLAAADLTLLRALLSCVSATIDPSLSAGGG